MVWLLRDLTANLAQPPVHVHDDPHYGMHPALFAFVFAVVSGMSLPIGAMLGIHFSPVSDKTCALMMAFGAGALLFAVTVELYGHSLHEVAEGRLSILEMFTTIFGALLGAAFYLTVNQWLEEYLMHDEKVECNPATPASIQDKDGKHGVAEDEEQPTESHSILAALRKQKKAQETLAEEVPEVKEAEVSKASPRSGKELWAKTRKKVSIISTMSLMASGDLSRVRAREKALRALHDPAEVNHAKSIAFALFLGLLVDGVPEGILMGFLSAEGHLTPVLIISLLVANFPEAFSSSSLLIQAQMSYGKILGMWTGLMLLVGSLAGLSCYLLLLWFPKFGQAGHGDLPQSVLMTIALTEGITGGAMIACISAVMLPEAFERAGKSGPFYSQSGFLCTAGFLLSVALKALFG